MKCPKCGAEIKDGHLYCEKCGEEIRIVPDFDATVDENIDIHFTDDIDTDGVIDELNKVVTKEIAKEIDNEATKEINLNEKPSDDNYLIKALVVAGAICAVLVVIGIAINNKVSSYYSVDVQYEKAFELYEEDNYKDSINILKHALSLDPNDYRLKSLLADNYFSLEKYDESNAVLYEIAEEFPEEASVYEKIIANYEAKGDFKSINQLLNEINDDELKEKYAEFLASNVQFSIEDGTYDSIQYLELYSNEGSSIYYSIIDNENNDDTESDIDRILYTGPVELDAGNYTVSAVSINEFGIESDEITKNYIIDFFVPDPPYISTKSAVYNVPVPIEVTVPDYELCYYTIDGEDPTVDDELYKGPIPMYIGKHVYKFAVISSKGSSSEVAELETTLDLIILVDMEMAENAIINYKSLKGGSDYTYDCEQATVVNGSTYYIVNEYSKSEDGRKATGNQYAVDVLTGASYRAIINKSTGEFKLEALI